LFGSLLFSTEYSNLSSLNIRIKLGFQMTTRRDRDHHRGVSRIGGGTFGYLFDSWPSWFSKKGDFLTPKPPLIPLGPSQEISVSILISRIYFRFSLELQNHKLFSSLGRSNLINLTFWVPWQGSLSINHIQITTLISSSSHFSAGFNVAHYYFSRKMKWT